MPLKYEGRRLVEYKPGFYVLPGSGDPVSKQDQPLFGTGIYKISASTNSQKYKKMTMLTSALAVSLDFSAILTAQKY